MKLGRVPSYRSDSELLPIMFPKQLNLRKVNKIMMIFEFGKSLASRPDILKGKKNKSDSLAFDTKIWFFSQGLGVTSMTSIKLS